MKKRILYFDILKIIASLAVILIHVISEFWYNQNILSNDFTYLSFFNSLIRWPVPIYLMISGALFLKDDKDITIKNLWRKNLLKIILLFFFWNMLYSILGSVYIEHRVVNVNNLIQILINTLLGNGIYHLWFLPIIISFYVTLPVIKLITKKENQKVIKYLLIVLASFFFIQELLTILKISVGYNLLFTQYIFYFLLGYYLNTFTIPNKYNKLIYFGGMLGVIVTFIGTITYSQFIKIPSEAFFNYMMPNIVITTTALFIFIKNKFKENKTNNIIGFLANTYFGVYLIHGLILGFYLKIGFFNLPLPITVLIIIGSLLIYITALIVVYLVNKVPYLKKLIHLN